MIPTAGPGRARLAACWQAGFLVAVVVAVAALVTQLRTADQVAPPAGVAGARPARSPAAVAAQTDGLLPCPSTSPAAPIEGPLRGVLVACLGSSGEVDLGAVLAGRATLLNLWASWCGPCRDEIPVLDAYARRPDAIGVVGLNVQDTPAAAASLLADLGPGYPSFIDTDDTTQIALQAPPVLPVTYYVGADGSITRITSPTVFRDPDEVRTAVSEAAR